MARGRLLRIRLLLLAALFLSLPAIASATEDAVRSDILRTEAGSMVLVQEIIIDVPIAQVWNA